MDLNEQSIVKNGLIDSLKETLEFINNISDDTPGWKDIISLYKKAIEKVDKDRYVSVHEASRIYLKFTRDYTSEVSSDDVYKVLEEASLKTNDYYKNILISYLKERVYHTKLDVTIEDLCRYEDIHEEIMNFILAGKQFDKTMNLEVGGYTAKQLVRTTILSPLGAYNYLVRLRDKQMNLEV